MRKTNFDQPEKIKRLIDKCEVCYMGMVDGEGMPYVLPFNFGLENMEIYLHSAAVGKKIDILQQNPNVCLAFSADHELKFVNEEIACSYSMRFRSVLAFGKVVFIEDPEEKKKALNIIMRQYVKKDDFEYNMPAVLDVKVYKVVVDRFTGKESGF
jgi:nitroimidazol reductase NimA-like FMN-containing flavoprotein (pyridoxamine 5'-phosphate oxidase superfamily)